ncbi:1-acyl-sn-glycerol-3-phosphate acyltransferase gamma-like [Ceratina calcarata]|uniref:1-acyl-sn-glycerol-3-phosphate acyltransferase gamma-like n=1 Tax=Ceratina calcarata TaxID=156304 RepID=A0AAJ7N8L2_9HYME|nr:1-acyl-sn-glycerol-3-phosphate acyltransferase gamma-like [Ceratina calcarata]XP_017883046.1 1-acyl-sn-glycerol-3-phosphate acyltransferase gamma-like [Ceratina calcarata]XP_026670881.1 1-acyl-sn-glycerol-3-phosphate acyltransferase gamma-like [Ceratina calcarata]
MGLLAMFISSNMTHLMFAITFFTSGLIINFFQLCLYVSLRPFSRYFYRKINYYLCYSFYAQLVFLVDWWSHSKTITYMEQKDYEEHFGKEHAYLIMNHRYEIDWLSGWAMAERVGVLGNCKAYAKKSLQYIPTVGWAWKFAELIFLERDWKKDQEIIRTQITELANYPTSIWLLLYPEGTRFTEQKLEASQKFAQEKGLPVLKHHLTPRTKGFVSSIPHMRGKIPAIYDVQVHFKSNEPNKPSITNLLLGKPVNAHLYMRRIPLEEVPREEEAAAKWLHELFQRKDRLAESFEKTGDFFATSGVPRMQEYELKPRLRSCLNTVVWSTVILLPILHHLISLLLSGSIFYFSIGVAIIVLFHMLMQKAISASEISKSSSYGTDGKKSN